MDRRIAALGAIATALSCATPHPEASSSEGTTTGESGTADATATSTSSPACAEPPPSDPPGNTITFRLTNATDHDVWHEHWHCIFGIGVTDAEGEAIEDDIWPSCEACSDEAATHCESPCNDHCDFILTRLPAGVSKEWTWSGVRWTTVDYSCEDCQLSCDQAIAAAPGTYQASATVYFACEDTGYWSCECELGDADTCDIFDWSASDPHVPTASFTLDDELVELIVTD